MQWWRSDDLRPAGAQKFKKRGRSVANCPTAIQRRFDLHMLAVRLIVAVARCKKDSGRSSRRLKLIATQDKPSVPSLALCASCVVQHQRQSGVEQGEDAINDKDESHWPGRYWPKRFSDPSTCPKDRKIGAELAGVRRCEHKCEKAALAWRGKHRQFAQKQQRHQRKGHIEPA